MKFFDENKKICQFLYSKKNQISAQKLNQCAASVCANDDTYQNMRQFQIH